MDSSTLIPVILAALMALIVGGAAAAFVAFKQGVKYRQKTAEAAIGSAEKRS